MRRSRSTLTGLILLAGLFANRSEGADQRLQNPGINLTLRSNGEPNGSDSSPEKSTPDTASSAARDASPHSAVTDGLLQQADKRLSSGRQFYFQGDLAGAKREFDAAVSLLLNAPDSLPDHRRIERRLDEMCDLIYRFDIEKLGSGQKQEEAAAFDEAPIDEISHMTFPVDKKLLPKIKTELNQTTSAIPLELSDPVLSYVHYFSSDRGRPTLLADFRRAGRYKPLIEKILAEEQLPQELIYVAQAESGFLPRAVSYKKAVGMWQFTQAAGIDYDLVHTTVFDERLDPEKSTRAAAKYLKDLYARYGDWYLAIAAYNSGPGVVDRAVERTGYADYWELLKRHALPKETANYVPIIVAMTIMAKNPGDYGLEHIESESPVEYDSIQVSASTNLNLIADVTMQPVSTIRDLNPSLLGSMAPAGFRVHLPEGTAQTAEAALETVPAQNRNAWRLHHVESGDTLEAIAKTYHLAPQRIAAVNREATSLAAGNVLLIPAAYHPDASRPQSRSHQRGRTGKGVPARSQHAARLHRSTHIAASRYVAAPKPHRAAALGSAGLQ